MRVRLTVDGFHGAAEAGLDPSESWLWFSFFVMDASAIPELLSGGAGLAELDGPTDVDPRPGATEPRGSLARYAADVATGLLRADQVRVGVALALTHGAADGEKTRADLDAWRADLGVALRDATLDALNLGALRALAEALTGASGVQLSQLGGSATHATLAAAIPEATRQRTRSLASLAAAFSAPGPLPREAAPTTPALKLPVRPGLSRPSLSIDRLRRVAVEGPGVAVTGGPASVPHAPVAHAPLTHGVPIAHAPLSPLGHGPISAVPLPHLPLPHVPLPHPPVARAPEGLIASNLQIWTLDQLGGAQRVTLSLPAPRLPQAGLSVTVSASLEPSWSGPLALVDLPEGLLALGRGADRALYSMLIRDQRVAGLPAETLPSAEPGGISATAHAQGWSAVIRVGGRLVLLDGKDAAARRLSRLDLPVHAEATGDPVLVPLGKGVALAVPIGEGLWVGLREAPGAPWRGELARGAGRVTGVGGPDQAIFAVIGRKGELLLTRIDRGGKVVQARARLDQRLGAATPLRLGERAFIALSDLAGTLSLASLPDLSGGGPVALEVRPIEARGGPREGAALVALAQDKSFFLAFADADGLVWALEGDGERWRSAPVSGDALAGTSDPAALTGDGGLRLAWVGPEGHLSLASGKGGEFNVVDAAILAR